MSAVVRAGRGPGTLVGDASWVSVPSLDLRAFPEVGWRGSEMQHFLEPELEGLEEVQFQGPDLELGSTISCLCVGSEGPREKHHVLAPRTSEGTETRASQECPRRLAA